MIPWAYHWRNWLDPEARELRRQRRALVRIARAGVRMATELRDAPFSFQCILYARDVAQPFTEFSNRYKNLCEELGAEANNRDQRRAMDKITQLMKEGAAKAQAEVDKTKGPWGIAT